MHSHYYITSYSENDKLWHAERHLNEMLTIFQMIITKTLGTTSGYELSSYSVIKNKQLVIEQPQIEVSIMIPDK